MRVVSEIINAVNENPAIDFNNIENVFLDRDGVLNRKPARGTYVSRVEDFALLPGVEDAVAALNRSGRKVIVVTNQRGIALGLYSQDDLERIHDELRARLAKHGAHLDAIYVCPHDAGQCDCRKPLTGLFEQAFRDFPEARPERSIIVGDSLRDIEAGKRAGMATAFVTNDDGPTLEDQKASMWAEISVTSLSELVYRGFCQAFPQDESR
jgi:D-glycero-D-manno-heptose 1,7-bisphosphate phosphatase